MSNRKPPTWMEDHRLHYERGLRCHLMGNDAVTMTREELIAFVGFLDELATDRRMQVQLELSRIPK